jgi:hypothetical protein
VNGTQTRIPLPKPPGLVALLEVRDKFAPRTWSEIVARREAETESSWREVPKTFRAFALKLARINPLQDCMPIETLTDMERAELQHVAGLLAKWAEALRKATA